MAFKARDGLPKVQLDRMSKTQPVATVKKLQKRETALLNQIAKLQAAAVAVEVADALQGVNSNDLKPGHIVQTPILQVPVLTPNELALLRHYVEPAASFSPPPWGTHVPITQEPPDLAQEHSQGSLGDQSNPPTPFPWEKT